MPRDAALTLRQWLAHLIRQKRLALSWRQEDLAAAARLSPKYIGEIERADKNPTIDAYETIFAALGLSLPDAIHTPAPPDPNRLLINAAILLLAEAVKKTFATQDATCTNADAPAVNANSLPPAHHLDGMMRTPAPTASGLGTGSIPGMPSPKKISAREETTEGAAETVRGRHGPPRLERAEDARRTGRRTKYNDPAKIFSREEGSPPVGPPRASEGVPPPARTGRTGPRMRRPSHAYAHADGAHSTGPTARQLPPRTKRKGP